MRGMPIVGNEKDREVLVLSDRTEPTRKDVG